MFVANANSNDVSVFDGDADTLVKKIPVLSGPTGLAATADEKLIYVTNALSDSVVIIDVPTLSMIGPQIAVGATPRGIAICVPALVDTIPPSCRFTEVWPGVVGVFRDLESGIARIDVLHTFNAIVTVEPFVPGAKVVNFRADREDENIDPIIFEILITDLAGNTAECDPAALFVSMDASPKSYDLALTPVDRFFYLKNSGVSQIDATVSGHTFTVMADENRKGWDGNVFFMPVFGEVVIDIGRWLVAENNLMTVTMYGQPGTSVLLFLSDQDFGLATHVDGKGRLAQGPDRFTLYPNYPNPFNPNTTIRFDIPATAEAQVSVHLRVFNLQGQLVRTLVDQKLPSGSYAFVWQGQDDRGRPLPSGVYFAQLRAGEFHSIRRMTLIK